jgi:UDP-N-acetylmuramate dehydrogenase
MSQITNKNGYIYAEAGVHLGVLSGYAASHSLSGLEFAYGIPGSLGGAVFMNAGAYGGEMKDVVAYSDYYDTKTDSFGRFSGGEQRFSYRKSVYSENKDLVILGAAIKLSEGNESEIRDLMNENMQKRRDKQPLEYPSAGSAFKRPKNDFAARMIDECGLKGYSVGGAAVSEKHAGFVINKGGATSADIKDLMKEVADRVFEKFGVRLESEIRYID